MPPSVDRDHSSLPRPDPVPLRPLEGRPIPAASLPRPLTSFIGRERQTATILGRLRREDVQLVTLTGPGGVGKTRLAIRVAETVAVDFPDGVWFVPLAPVRDPSLIPATIASALGVQETSERPVVEGLTTFLAGRRGLLVLDNFEHVLDAGPLVTDLLARCPALKVLVTSRTVLRLSGEHDIVVPPLASVDPDRLPPLDRVRETEAVRLFVDRAVAAHESFALTEANAPDVAWLCTRLDGLPLAIELAAARVRSLPLPAMVRRLELRLNLLTGGPRDQPARLQTMRDAIAWSYNLLTPEEQTFFRRLAVFVGGFTLQAAEWVAGWQGDSPRHPATLPPASATLNLLASLVDKSLLRQDEGPEGEPRYLMLETVREFGLEQLAAAGEMDDTRRRQGAYYLTWLTPKPSTTGEALSDRRWLDLLETEEDNLWSVLSWSLELGEIEVGLRLAGTMMYYWYLRKRRLTEARAWLDRGLERGRLAGASDEALADGLICASALAHLHDDTARARTMAEEALAIFHRVGAPHDIAAAHYVLAVPAYMQGDLSRAEQHCQEALRHFRAEGDRYWVAEVLLGLAHVAIDRGDHERAATAYEESLQLSRQLASRPCAARAQSGLGFLARARGDAEAAYRLFQESLAVWGEIDDATSIAVCLEAIAGTICSLGRPLRAARLLGAAEALRERISYPIPRGALPTYQQTVAGIQSSLSMVQFSTAWLAGRTLSPAEAIALAREDLPAPDAVHAETDRTPGSARTSDVSGHDLTPREMDVLRLVAAGRSNREIADALFISVPTVKRHLSTIFGKLALPSRSAATAYAHTHRLV